MKRSFALIAMLAVSATAAYAQPTASLPSGFTFVDWLTHGRTNVQLGRGLVDESNKLFYFKEKEVAGFQSWYIFFDPSGSQRVRGTVTFDSQISSLITTTAGMLAGDVLYGVSAVSYTHLTLPTILRV